MPRRKPADELSLEAQYALTQPEIDIDDFFESLGPGSIMIEIYRLRDDGRRPQLGKVTLDIVREDAYAYCREKFGAGRYLLMGKDEHNKYRKSKVIEVETEAKSAVPVGNGTGGNDGFMRDILIAMIANQKPQAAPPPIDVGSLLNGLAAMRPPAPPPPPDIGLMFTTVLTAVTSIVGKGNNMKETLELIQAAKGLDSGGDGGGDSGTLGIVREIGKGLSGLFGGRVAPVDNPGEGVGLAAGGVRQERQPLAAGSEADTMRQWISSQIGFLKEKARAGKPFEMWVEYILDNQEEPGCRAVVMALESGATFDNLLAVDPEISENPILRAFFKGLYDGLHREIFATDDPGGAAGDVGNVASDAPAIAPTIAKVKNVPGEPKKKRAK